MPIQFRCRECNQWIEVDAEHAGAKAACPFCQAVNAVPESPEQPERPEPDHPDLYTHVPTETTSEGEPDVPVSKPPERRPPTHPEWPDQREQARFDAERAGLPRPGRTWLTHAGLASLIGAVLSIGMMALPIAMAMHNLPPSIRQRALSGERIEPAEARQMQAQAVEHIQTYFQTHTALSLTLTLGGFLWLASLATSLIVVFSAGEHRRTYGYAALTVNAILLSLCVCSGIMQSLAGL